ncbi:MAG TPA: hypothetical protein VEZ44_15035 [bacterium]|nr:hypothetical protein [bacterium]
MMGVSVADWSLAVIAVAVAAAVAALVPALLQIRRTAMRAEAVLARVDGALPSLVRDLDGLIKQLSRTTDTVANLAASVERLEKLSTSAVRSVDGVLETIGHAARDVVLPSLASVAGFVSVLREGMEWVRPRRDRRRDGE